MIVGLAAVLPTSLYQGLVHQGVPKQVATGVSHLPPVSTLFAAFLGYNPMQHLLGGSVLAHLPAGKAAVLQGRSFFPNLIVAPFRRGCHRVRLRDRRLSGGGGRGRGAAASATSTWTGSPNPPATSTLYRRRHQPVTPPTPTITDLTRIGEGIERPEQVLVDRQGKVYASDKGSAVAEITPGGELRRLGRAGGEPNGIALRDDGHFLIANFGLGALQDLDPVTGTIDVLVGDEVEGRPLRWLNYVLVDSGQNIWASVSTSDPISSVPSPTGPRTGTSSASVRATPSLGSWPTASTSQLHGPGPDGDIPVRRPD